MAKPDPRATGKDRDCEPHSSPVGRRSTRSRRLGLLAGLVFLLLGVLGVIAWSVKRGADDDTSPRALVDEPGVEHVHGLGINPADGSLYVATHTGTFRIPEDGPADDANRRTGIYRSTDQALKPTAMCPS